jgi:hypothetical protein
MKRSWLASLLLLAGFSPLNAFAQGSPAAPPTSVARKDLPEAVSGTGLRYDSLPVRYAPPTFDPTLVQPASLGLDGTIPVDDSRLYGGAEFLLWWMKKSNPPPLITSGDPKDNPAGAMGKAGTSVLFTGPEGPGAFSGVRFSLGYWFDPEKIWALEANGFFLNRRSVGLQPRSTGAAGTGTLNIPFFNADSNSESAYQVAVAGSQAGVISVTAPHRFAGAELNLRGRIWEGETCRFYLLGGFRYLSLEEGLELETSWTGLPASKGTSQTTSDRFSTRNHFYAAQVGVAGNANFDRLTFIVQGKIALGGMNETVAIDGGTVSTSPAGIVTSSRGVFTGPNNLGEHSRSQLAMVPEASFTLDYPLARHVNVMFGYSFLYINQVVRPGDHIDRVSNAAGSRPAFAFHTSDIWVQGVNVGLLLRY